MARMTAELVVRLMDGVSGPAARARTSLTSLQRAERDVMLARGNTRLSRVQLAEERLLAQQEAEREKRLNRIAGYGRVAGMAIAAGGYAAISATRNYAALERTIGRIVLNADKTADAIKPTMAMLQQMAQQTAMPFDQIVSGLEALIASGRGLDESLSFLPTIAMTAQATGAEINDIALTADALARSLHINAEQMLGSFDVLAKAGQAGKFELKDMAAELPALLPAFAQLGYKGEAGLKKIAAMLQIVRNQTGSSAEAATNLGNVVQKAYSNDVANAFKKFHIDIRAEMDKTRKAGGDVLETLVAQTNKALKGDLSRLPLLFGDVQMQNGIRALMSQIPELKKLFDELGTAVGTVDRNFQTFGNDSEAKFQRLSETANKLVTTLGALGDTVVTPTLDALNSQLTDAMAIIEGGKRLAASGRDEGQTADQWRQEYRAMHPDAWFPEVNRAFNAALAQLGRGQIKNIYEPIRREQTSRRVANAWNDPSRAKDVLPARGDGSMPVPTPRPDPAAGSPYDWHGYTPAKGGQKYVAPPERMPGAFDLDAFEQKMRSGGFEAGNSLSNGVSQGGEQAAQALTQAIVSAGTQVAKQIAQAIATARVVVSAQPQRSGPTTGQAIRTASEGQAIDRDAR